ncbi:MAG: YihY/virulence factor BrkB family protein [Polyangia bacterium]
MLWHLRLSWWGFCKRLYQKYEDNEVGDSAAAISYYFIFSLFPFLFFLATLIAYIPFARGSTDTLLARARAILPSEAMGIVEMHLRGLMGRPRPHLLTLGLAAAVYSASCGVDALRKGLNLAYDVKESRPLWKTESLAFGITVGGGLLVLVGIALLVAGGSAGLWAARYLHIADEYVIVLRWIRWPIVAIMITLGAAFSYYLLPDVEQKFKFITPGSVIGTLVSGRFTSLTRHDNVWSCLGNTSRRYDSLQDAWPFHLGTPSRSSLLGCFGLFSVIRLEQLATPYSTLLHHSYFCRKHLCWIFLSNGSIGGVS